MIRHIAIALVSTALLTATAGAETAKKASTETTTSHRTGEWRASKLVGVNVYNEANEKIGDISDVILSDSGKVASVVLGVGGFLGMGEHYVAVPYEKLKWSNQPVSSTTTSDAKTRPADDTTARRTDDTNRTTGTATTRNDNWYPDHVVYNATKDQLKAMPQFKY